MLSEMSNNNTSIKTRGTPPKEQASASSLPETKKDFSPYNSETSSISEEGAVQETIQCKSEVNTHDTLPSTTGCPSMKISVTETKENVNPRDITKDDNTSATGKRKKPKSKLDSLIIYIMSIECCMKFNVDHLRFIKHKEI